MARSSGSAPSDVDVEGSENRSDVEKVLPGMFLRADGFVLKFVVVLDFAFEPAFLALPDGRLTGVGRGDELEIQVLAFRAQVLVEL